MYLSLYFKWNDWSCEHSTHCSSDITCDVNTHRFGSAQNALVWVARLCILSFTCLEYFQRKFRIILNRVKCVGIFIHMENSPRLGSIVSKKSVHSACAGQNEIYSLLCYIVYVPLLFSMIFYQWCQSECHGMTHWIHSFLDHLEQRLYLLDKFKRMLKEKL